MNTDQQPSLFYRLCRRGGMMLFCLLVAAVTGLSATGWADSLFLITGADGAEAIILDPDQKEAPDLSSQMVYVSNGSRGYDITLQEDTTVTVRHEGSALTIQSRKESVSSLLSRLHIYPSSLEMIGVKLSENSVEVNVSSDLTYYDYVTETAPFATQRVANPELPEGEEKVVQEGADGVRSSVYEVVWSNGAQLSRQFVEELDTTAVDRIIEYGTAKPKPKPSETKQNPGDHPDGARRNRRRHCQRRGKRRRKRRPDPQGRHRAELLRRPLHDRHSLYHGTRRRGHPHRQRHRRSRGLRGRG